MPADNLLSQDDVNDLLADISNQPQATFALECADPRQSYTLTQEEYSDIISQLRDDGKLRGIMRQDGVQGTGCFLARTAAAQQKITITREEYEIFTAWLEKANAVLNKSMLKKVIAEELAKMQAIGTRSGGSGHLADIRLTKLDFHQPQEITHAGEKAYKVVFDYETYTQTEFMHASKDDVYNTHKATGEIIVDKNLKVLKPPGSHAGKKDGSDATT